MHLLAILPPPVRRGTRAGGTGAREVVRPASAKRFVFPACPFPRDYAPHQGRSSPVIKQLVTALVGAAAIVSALAISGCKKEPPKAQGPTIGAIPPNSFVQHWRAPLKLENDSITELHLRDANLYAYTRGDVVYSLSRAGGDTQFGAPVQASGGVLRPPIEIKDRIVFPTATTMEIYR